MGSNNFVFTSTSRQPRVPGGSWAEKVKIFDDFDAPLREFEEDFYQ